MVLDLLDKELKFIPEEELPGKVKKKSGEWLRFLTKIPKGQALVVSEKELGVKAASLKSMVNRLVRNRALPPTYYVTQRTTDDKTTIYVVNSAQRGSREKGKHSTVTLS